MFMRRILFGRGLGNIAQFPPDGSSTAPAAAAQRQRAGDTYRTFRQE